MALHFCKTYAYSKLEAVKRTDINEWPKKQTTPSGGRQANSDQSAVKESKNAAHPEENEIEKPAYVGFPIYLASGLGHRMADRRPYCNRRRTGRVVFHRNNAPSEHAS